MLKATQAPVTLAPVKDQAQPSATSPPVLERGDAEANLTALIESTADHIWSIDLDSRLLTLNSSARNYLREVYGATLEVGQSLLAALPPDRAALWEELCRRALSEGHFSAEYHSVTGRIFVFSFNEIVREGRQVGISAIGHDTTEERAAFENQRLLAAIVQGSDEAIHAISLDGRVASWNRGGELLLGYTTEQILGQPLVGTIVRPERAGVITWLLEEIGEGRSVGPYDTQLRARDGQLIDFSVTISPIRDELGRICGGAAYARDIRSRKHTERLLRDSEERYRATFEQAAIGIVHCGFDGLILRCNARFASMLGYKPRDLVGLAVADITAPEHLQKSENFIHSIATSAASTANFEKLYLHRNGSKVWGRITVSAQRDGRGEPIHLVSLIEDITEQKAAEEGLSAAQQALAVSEARYRLAFDNTLDAININRLEDGLYLECNPAFQNMFGYTREETLGRTSIALEIWHDPEARKRMVEAVRATGLCRNLEARFRKKSGELIWAQISASSMEVDGVAYIVTLARDITAAKEAELLLAEAAEKVRLSEQRYAAVFRTSSDGILVIRRDNGVIVDANPTFIDFMGYERREIVGHTARTLRLWVDPEERSNWLRQVVRGSGSRGFEARFRKKDGALSWALISASVLEIDGVPSIIVIARDISAAKAAEHEIRTLAFFDPLTGLPNRRLLLERLEQATSSGMRSGRCRALLFLDLDNFKVLNDTLGHQIGDLILCEAARRIAGSVRESDTVARLGGDEFVIMLLDLSLDSASAADQARSAARKVLVAMDRPFLLEGRECRSTCSIGITLFGNRKISPEDILQQADIAMYEAKAAGRNTLHFFAPSLQAAVHARAAVEEQLRQSLRKGEFILHFQPQIDDGELFAAECLVRWCHPRRGLLAPAEFIRVAEEAGLILPLGALVLDQACARIALWQQNPRAAHLIVAVNVSPVQLRQPDFVDNVLEALQRHGAKPERLTLELTESMLVDSIDDVMAKMSALKQHGIHFALDDFGTGYSSLAYLKRLPLDQLKIDRAFIRDILDDQPSGAIAETIVSLGRAMGLAVIAEGVETTEQQQYLRRLGCHCFQGYLFGRPVPIEEFEQRWLEG